MSADAQTVLGATTLDVASVAGHSAQSPTRRAWRRFRRNRLAFGGLIFLIVVVLMSVFAPWIARTDPVSLNLRADPPGALQRALVGHRPGGS